MGAKGGGEIPARIKNREALTKIYKASKPKEMPAAPPKPRIAKGR
jgi:hypothetical protein